MKENIKFYIGDSSKLKSHMDDNSIAELFDKEEHYEYVNENEKFCFKNANYQRKIRRTFITIPVLLFVNVIAGLILDYSDLNASSLGVIYIFYFFISILGSIVYPFTIKKYVIFDIDEKLYISRILKKNFIGLNSVLLNMEYPNPIGRIVVKETESYTYITFREVNGDVIRQGSPVLILEKMDKDSSDFVFRILNKLIEYSNHKVSLNTI